MNMKRLICLALAALMMLSAGVVVFAEEPDVQANARTGSLGFVLPQYQAGQYHMAETGTITLNKGESVTLTLVGELDDITIGLCSYNPGLCYLMPFSFLLRNVPVTFTAPASNTSFYFTVNHLRDAGDYDMNYGYINYSIESQFSIGE